MANQNSAKGNPASHRMGNPKLKERRAKSWARSEKRKEKNRLENEKAHAAKKANGGLGRRELRRIESGKRQDAYSG